MAVTDGNEADTGATAARRNDTRDRLLMAAIELFGSHGYESTSLRDIAARVGVKAPAIYNHFESKEELLGEAVCWMIRDFIDDVVGNDDPSLSPDERLRSLMRRHVVYQVERGSLVRASDFVVGSESMRTNMPEDRIEQVRSDMRRYLDLLTDLVADVEPGHGPRRRPAPRVIAFALIGMCDRVQTWFRPDGGLTADEVADQFWLFARPGLGLD